MSATIFPASGTHGDWVLIDLDEYTPAIEAKVRAAQREQAAVVLRALGREAEVVLVKPRVLLAWYAEVPR